VAAATSTRRYTPSESGSRCVNGLTFPTNMNPCQTAANARRSSGPGCNAVQRIVAILCVWLASTSVSTLTTSSKIISRRSRCTRSSSPSIRRSGVLRRRGGRAPVCAISKSLLFPRSAYLTSWPLGRFRVTLKRENQHRTSYNICGN